MTTRLKKKQPSTGPGAVAGGAAAERIPLGDLRTSVTVTFEVALLGQLATWAMVVGRPLDAVVNEAVRRYLDLMVDAMRLTLADRDGELAAASAPARRPSVARSRRTRRPR